MPCEVFIEPEAVTLRLSHVGQGLTEQTLHDAIAASRYARRRATALHPPLTGPFNAHADATATLRLKLAPHGWEPSNKKGYPTTVYKPMAIGIAVASGDDGTGRQDRIPTTRSEKGACTERAVLANSLTLFGGLTEEHMGGWGTGTLGTGDSKQTWILLIHEGEDETRAELSLPSEYGDNRRPVSWAERIILKPLPNDDDGDGASVLPNDTNPDLDVPVSLKVA